MSDPEMTVQSMFDELDKWGAAKMEMVFRDGDDVPMRAVIVVDGIPETGDVVKALAKVQERWDAIRDAEPDAA